MSAISETIDRILGRNGHERIPTPYWDTEESKMSNPIFSEFVSIINAQETITDSELSDIHSLLLDDEICQLIWEDSYPLSETNNADHEKDIGSLAITAIFNRFRPPEEAIIAKKDSPKPYSRLFCIWMCTSEARTGVDYDVLAELLFDEIAGVGNQALAQLGDVVSSHRVLYQAIRDYLDPQKPPKSRNPNIVHWLFMVLDEISRVTFGTPFWEPRGEDLDSVLEDYNWGVLYDTDMHIQGGDKWVRAIALLQDDLDWMKHRFGAGDWRPPVEE